MTVALKRLPDWEPRLHTWLDQCSDRPHVYGKHDCVLFVAGAVAAMTDVDPAAHVRGRYRSAAGAVRALRLHGAGSLPTTLTAALGDPVPLAWAHRGDICRYGTAAGILMAGHGVFVGRAEADDETFGLGLVRVPRHLLDPLAWGVPFA
jgi:hypothetical protein